MLVLCTGMIRSGSTWSYNVCAALLRSAFGAQAVAGGYHESLDLWRRYATDAEAHAVVKCHQVTSACRDWLATQPQGSIRFVFTLRSPREVVASAINAFALSYDECRGSMSGSLEFLAWQKRLGHVCVVPHHAIVEAPEAAVAVIAGSLGLTLGSSAIAETARACAREAMSERVTRRFDHFPVAEVYRDERYVYHRPTLLHRTHFRAPDAPDWPDLLTSEQLDQLDEEFAPFRALLAREEAWIEGDAKWQGRKPSDPRP